MTSDAFRLIVAENTVAISDLLQPPEGRVRVRRALRGVVVAGGLAAMVAVTGCSSDDSVNPGASGMTGQGGSGTASGGNGGSATGGGGGSAGANTGSGGGAGGSAGANTGSGGGAGGSSGSSGASGGGASGNPDSGGVGGSGGQDAGAEGSSEAAAPCPGAGKSLHFSDDVGGMTTVSTQLMADLGTDLPIGNAARTIEMWLYMEGTESWKAEHSIVEYGGQGRCQAFGIDGGDNGMRDPIQFDPFTFSGGGPCSGDNNGNITPAPPRTGWLHLAWSYDPTSSLAYGGQTNLAFLFTVNGVPQNIPAKTQTGMLLTLSTMVSIGSGQITNDGFTGKMDEFRFWNVARTATEIAQNYQLILKGDEPGLVAYYHFDDGAGTTATDASSKHHNAAFVTAGNRPVPTWVDSTGLTLTCKP
jgi:hypothetical protein